MKSYDTAILIFSRFAEEEARQKKYKQIAGQKGGQKIAGELINYTINEATFTHLPVYTIFSDKQYGNCFGERLANAIEKVFSLGFIKVIVLGTNSPSVTSSGIKNAAELLLTNKLVLGPSNDGGVYLIGIDKKGYYREPFINIPWLGKKVFKSCKEYAFHFQLPLITQTIGEDFDNISSFFSWQFRNKCNKLALVFTKIISAFNIIHQCLFLLIYGQNFWIKYLLTRGPPSVY